MAWSRSRLVGPFEEVHEGVRRSRRVRFMSMVRRSMVSVEN